MKKVFLSAVLAMMLSNCATTTRWVAGNFEQQDCRVPEKLAVTATLDNYMVVVSIFNTTRELWQLDLDLSQIRLPEASFSSNLVDNHEGNPNAPKTPLLPGKSVIKLYPGSMITETDEELKDVHFKPWPGTGEQPIEIALGFITPDGQNTSCILRASLSPLTPIKK